MLIYDEITEKGIVTRNKPNVSIERIRALEPKEGYYLAYSGGKDSDVILDIMIRSEAKFDVHYSRTTVDPPEVIYHIEKRFEEVEKLGYECTIEEPKESMWKLIEKKGLPTRLNRFCCSKLKENGGKNRFVTTGVRWDESVRRKTTRHAFETFTTKQKEKQFTDDNDMARMMFENCLKRSKFIANPIIDWLDEDVWEYIGQRKICTCCLYKEGHKRIGCIGCPLIGQRGMLRDFARWPKYEINYKKAIGRFLVRYLDRCKENGKKPFRDTVDGWWTWWLYGKEEEIEVDDDQIMIGG